ncbi:MAG: M20 family metallopeptidase [Deltaproteobacteria bacterium]|nr:M20 family metallopeptidase [Deltaproteobacteria bacterium]
MDALEVTRKLISFNTINPPGQEQDCATYLGKMLEDGGFKTRYYPFAEGRPNVIATIDGGGDKSPICFTGHMDTVPLGDTRWEHDPFSGERDGDKIYGRGATDTKGGVAAMVMAALDVAKSSLRKAGITLVITAGEETGCEGALHLTQLAGALGRAGAMVIVEPTSNYPLVAHKGALWLDASTTGVTAHGSMPEEGVNAIYKAARAAVKLEKFRFNVPAHPLLGAPTLNVGRISGGKNYNIVPDSTVIGIDIRTIPGQNNRQVLNELRSCLGEDVEVKPVIDVGGISTDPDHPWMQDIFKIMEKYIKESAVARGATYFTDGSALTPAYGNPPTVVLGPGEPAMAHKTDEFCYISKIEDATAAYTEIARQWCHG